MKAYVPFHPAHPGTYAFRVARCFALFFILVVFTACGSVKKRTKIEATQQLEEHVERVSVGQSIFALIDSLNATHSLEADSLELEIFALEIPSVENDSLAAT